MNRAYERLIESILRDAEEIGEIETFAEGLASYIEHELAGEDVKERFPDFHGELSRKSDLQEKYQILYTLVAMEQEGELLPPPHQVEFDSSFLSDIPLPKPASSLWQDMEDHKHRLVVDLVTELGEKLLTMVDIPSLLLPHHQRTLVPATLRLREGSHEEDDLQEMQALPDPERNINIKLFMGPIQARQATIMVQLQTMEPVAFIQKAIITLRYEDGRLLARKTTDGQGSAFFKEIQTGGYLLQIKHNEMWEIPFKVIG
ncbi:MAG: hypothetical protein AAF702_51085 [Chloroflexota bacterium]